MRKGTLRKHALKKWLLTKLRAQAIESNQCTKIAKTNGVYNLLIQAAPPRMHVCGSGYGWQADSSFKLLITSLL